MGRLVDWFYRRFKGETEKERLMRRARRAVRSASAQSAYNRKRPGTDNDWFKPLGGQ